MTTPDVRIRLSAEGVAEVVAALKKVQGAADAAGKGGGRSFSPLNGVLKSTTGLLGELLPALSVGAFVGFIAKSSEAAEAVGRLKERTGASAQGLSALRLAATESDTDLEGLSVGLVRLNKNLGLLKEGSPDAVKNFHDLGLSAKDFKGKDAAQAFELVSKRITGMGDAARRGQSSMAILGKSGANLLPLMKGVADEGLSPLIERARQLGVLLDDEVIAATERMNDDFKLIKLQAEGLGIQFATGLSPALSQTFEIFSGELSNQAEAWRNFGKAVGDVIKWIVAIVSTAFDQIGTSVGTLAIRIDGLVRGFGRLITGDLKGAGQAVSFAFTTADEEQRKLAERTTQRFKAAATEAPPAKLRERAPGEGEEGPDPAALAKKRADAANAILETELSLARARNKLLEEEDKRTFDHGLMSIEEYYRRRREVVEKGAAAEQAAIDSKRSRLSAEVDPERRRVDAAKLDADQAKLRLDTEAQLNALTSEEVDAVRELGKARMAAEKGALEVQGRRHEAALQDIQEQMFEYNRLLEKQGLSDEERFQAVKRLRLALTAGADFEEAERTAKAGMADPDAERQSIEARVEAGQLTQLQGEEALLAAEKARLANLEDLAQALLAAAEATGDPEKIRAAQEFAGSVASIGLSLDQATRALGQFKQAAEDAISSALTDFFSGKYFEDANRQQEEDMRRIQERIDAEDKRLRQAGVSDSERSRRLQELRKELEGAAASAHNLGSVFKAMALDIVQALRQVAAQMLAVAIMKKLAGLFGGGGEVPSSPSASRKASGGLLRGPGSGTSDNLLIWASPGEFVVRAAVVGQPGIRDHLERLNRGLAIPEIRRAPAPGRGFAEGGLVESAPAKSPRDGRLLVGLDTGLVLKELQSPEGQKLLVQMIARNRRAVQHATR